MNGREPYLSAASTLLAESGCTVRKWRRRTTGVAYIGDGDWGIEAPEPRGPISFATLAHEVGHQMLHRGTGRGPRWLEELEAWEYALDQFARFDLPGLDEARADGAKSIRYAIRKAIRSCSAATAQAILDRVPEWAYVYADPRDAVVENFPEAIAEVARGAGSAAADPPFVVS